MVLTFIILAECSHLLSSHKFKFKKKSKSSFISLFHDREVSHVS